MFTIFKSTSFDRSPFTYPTFHWYKDQVQVGVNAYDALRSVYPTAINSNHLLHQILATLPTVNGSHTVLDYHDVVLLELPAISSVCDITSLTNHGKLFKDVFYKGSIESITAFSISRDLIGKDWVSTWDQMPSIRVFDHSITNLSLYEIGVLNRQKVSTNGYAHVNIDIPLFACQYIWWKKHHPELPDDFFLSSIPIRLAMRSHLDIVLINKVAELLKIIPSYEVPSNVILGVGIPNLHDLMESMIETIVKNLISQAMPINRILTSIPTFYSGNAFDSAVMPITLTDQQCNWSLIEQQLKILAIVLEVGKLTNTFRQTELFNKLRRLKINIVEGKVLQNGFDRRSFQYLQARLRFYLEGRY